MQGLFFETDTGARYILRGLVVLIGLWTAWRTGKAVAESWGEWPRVLIYTLLLAAALRFMHFALFAGPMLHAGYYLLDFVMLLILSTAGFRARRTTQMVDNYYWLYDKSSVFAWKKKD